MSLIARFLTVGALNTLVGLSCIYAAMGVFGFGLIAANAIGYGVGLVLSFHLNRSWTFNHRGAWAGAFARWLGVVGVAYLCNLAAASLAAWTLGLNAYVAQLCGVAVYTVVSFLGARRFAFAQAEIKGVGARGA